MDKYFKTKWKLFIQHLVLDNDFSIRQIVEITEMKNTHMKKLFYLTQYKHLLRYKLGCFCPFSYDYTISSVINIPLSYIKGYSCLKKLVPQIDWKWMVAPLSRFYGKICIVFGLSQKKKIFLEVSFQIQKNGYRFLWKTDTRYFESSLPFERLAYLMMMMMKLWNKFSRKGKAFSKD